MNDVSRSLTPLVPNCSNSRMAGLRDTLSRWPEQEPSPPFGGQREGPAPQAWEGEVGAGQRSGIPHLTPTLSAPKGGKGDIACLRSLGHDDAFASTYLDLRY
jgi:hypothetical protein